MAYQGIWADRRTAKGKIKPFLFAALEIAVLLMCIWVITSFDILMLAALSYMGAMFYIVTTVIPRYKNAIERQKYARSLK
ncbi:MAG: hypothetical protein L3J43_09965 [Sulfurovum sp.]|nr:hypothetical protein [Sulfurovum sp.]